MPAILPRQLQPCCIQRSDNGCQVCEASRLQQRVLAWQSSTRVKHEIRQKKSPMVSPHTSAKSSAGQTTCQFKGEGSIIQFESIHGICPSNSKDWKNSCDACLFISKARSFFWCSNDLDVGLFAALGFFPTTLTCCLHVTPYHPLPYIWCFEKISRKTLKKMRIHMQHLEPN